jgi:chloride channel 7
MGQDDDDDNPNITLTEEKKVPIQSMNFEEIENYAWRLHQTRRFYHDIGTWWNATRRTTVWKWFLVILVGAVIGCMGVMVRIATGYFTDLKFSNVLRIYDSGNVAGSYFTLLGICLLYASIAAITAVLEPNAAGSGLPEIKAFLNGINLNKIVRFQIVIFKVIGMCFICAAGLPLGKEGPMIHCGAVIGAAISQGKTFTFGYDTTWTKFQDLRNDRSKRDFVTFGAAAGVAAAFSAPIGGVLFALEEGASFWSATVTFRAFFCAMISDLVIATILVSGMNYKENPTVFPFGTFRQQQYFQIYELFIFAFVGMMGGLLGALFNHFTKLITEFRQKYINVALHRRLIEVAVITIAFTTIGFVSSVGWTDCTPKPTDVGLDDDTFSMNSNTPLLQKVVSLQCDSGTHFNQLATLWLNEANTAMQLLFHMPQGAFSASALMAFVVPYFLVASIISGGLYPAGLFVPTLLSGAALGRLFGHMLAQFLPNADISNEGIYALLGAAALMGGMSRMTIAGTVILLEAVGNSDYLLPLMLTFAAARYTGNAINLPLYDMMIDLKKLPFLEGHLGGLGLLNYHSVHSVMAQPVKTLYEVNKVRNVYELLMSTQHNGFPVISKDGRLRGLVQRKTLVTMLKLRAFSVPIFEKDEIPAGASPRTKSPRVTSPRENDVQLTTSATISHDALERTYPKYPQIEEVQLSEEEKRSWIDVRNYMETAPYSLNESASISRCYRLFRTMGLRHLILTDNQHHVTGIITRHDITEHKLAHEWRVSGNDIKSYYSHGNEPAFVSEREALVEENIPVDCESDDSIQVALAQLRAEGSDLDQSIDRLSFGGGSKGLHSAVESPNLHRRESRDKATKQHTL